MVVSFGVSIEVTVVRVVNAAVELDVVEVEVVVVVVVVVEIALVVIVEVKEVLVVVVARVVVAIGIEHRLQLSGQYSGNGSPLIK